jgi:hypothetical protein
MMSVRCESEQLPATYKEDVFRVEFSEEFEPIDMSPTEAKTKNRQVRRMEATQELVRQDQDSSVYRRSRHVLTQHHKCRASVNVNMQAGMHTSPKRGMTTEGSKAAVALNPRKKMKRTSNSTHNRKTDHLA